MCVLRRARCTDAAQLARFSTTFHPLVRLSRREVVAGTTGAGKVLRIGRTVVTCSCACTGGAGAGGEVNYSKQSEVRAMCSQELKEVPMVW